MSHPPSGEQFELRYAEQHATVVEVGGGVRSYRNGKRDVLQPYDVDAMCDGAHGTPLIPWPNRLAGGSYTFDEVDYQCAITEPEKNNAIHGFLRWRNWNAAERSESHVVMAHTLHPMKGYPFALFVEVRYELDENGLSVTTRATNIGDGAAPYACGQHPYLSPGDGTIDACRLAFAASTRIATDAQRELPIGLEKVAGSVYDFAEPRLIGDTKIDYAFTDLARDERGCAWVSLTGRDARTVDLWVDSTYPIVELFTADTLSDARARRGLGVEPMTAPPNAFASGDGLARLEPGDSSVNAWGVGLRPEPGGN